MKQSLETLKVIANAAGASTSTMQAVRCFKITLNAKGPGEDEEFDAMDSQPEEVKWIFC